VDLSGDARLLLVRTFDWCIGLTRALTDPLESPQRDLRTQEAHFTLARRRRSTAGQ
jgi:hypothetical protein